MPKPGALLENSVSHQSGHLPSGFAPGNAAIPSAEVLGDLSAGDRTQEACWGPWLSDIHLDQALSPEQACVLLLQGTGRGGRQ